MFLEHLQNSEIFFRLKQEGYVLLISLLILFTISILVANILAFVLTQIINGANLLDRLFFSGKHKKGSRG